MRLSYSAAAARIDWRELAGKGVAILVTVLVGAGCGAVVRIAIALSE